MISLIGLIIFGAVIGILARLVLPGRQRYGIIITIILGIVGALIGYWLAGKLGVGNTPGIDWIRWIISVAAAAVLSVIFSAMTGRGRSRVR
jgi:uncharacterized membrane protein YeaQ/YmgE (transglycosylase-associated protein family)